MGQVKTRAPSAFFCAQWTGAGLIACALVGCSGDEVVKRPTGDVTGTVTFKGQPVTEGTVVFDDGMTGTVKGADLGPEGKFKLLAVPAASYSVFIVPKPAPFTPPPDDPAKKAPEAEAPDIPRKYRAAKTSGLTATVKAGSANEFSFKMEE